MSETKIHKHKSNIVELFFCSVVMLALCISAWGRFDLPSFWDETKVYFRPLFWMFEHSGNFYSLEPTPFDRPPGMHLFYLPFIWLFGPHISIIRILNFIYFIFGSILFYRSIQSEDKFSAKLVLLYFIMTPIVQVYFLQYIGDPQQFVFYASVLFLLRFYSEKYIWLFIVGFLAGITREPSLFLTPAIFFYYYFSTSNEKLNIRQYIAAVGPIAGFLLITIINYLRNDSIMSHVTLASGHLDLMMPIAERARFFYYKFIVLYRLWPLGISCLLSVFIYRKKIKFTSLDAFCLILIVLNLLLFSSHKMGLPRYYLSVFPFVVYLLYRLCLVQIENKRIRQLVGASILIFTIALGAPKVTQGEMFLPMSGYQDTFKYVELLELHKNVISLVKSKLIKDETLLTSWPFFEIFASRYAGYGPPGEFKVINEFREGGPIPDAILWTNFPEQILRTDIDKILARQNYTEFNFDMKPMKIRLYLKD